MRIALGFGISALLMLSVEGQDEEAVTSEQPLRVIGQVADGRPGLPSAPKVLPAAEILNTKLLRAVFGERQIGGNEARSETCAVFLVDQAAITT